jgi:hypothetical protein
MADISSLIDKVADNEIVLPELQREFVWKKDQAKSLINSLYQGFPIGSLLIWETKKPPKIKNDAIDRDTGGLFKVLLDGQQRLTVLYLVIEDEIPPYYEDEEINYDPRNLFFNVDNGDFQYENRSIRDSPEWVKVTDVFSGDVSAFQIARETVGEEEDSYARKAEEYQKQIQKLKNIKNADMPKMELPKSAEVHDAIELFDRVNSQGTDLGEAELALAHMSAEWPYIRREMKEKQEEMKKKGFDFDLDFYVKCMIATVTGTMTYDKVYDKDEKVLKDKWGRIDRTLDFVVRFLKNQAYLPNSNYVSTRASLIPLVAYIESNDIKMSQKEKKSFQKWLYSALMWSRYSRATDSKLTTDLSLLQNGPNPTKELLEEVKDESGRIEVEASDLEGRGKRSRRFYNMVMTVTRANNPVDWKTGEPLNGNFELHSHHIFPRSRLYDEKYDSNNHMHKKKVNEIANRAFLTKEGNWDIDNDLPEDYLPEVDEKHGDALERQFVPKNPELWKLENYEEFLQKRRELLASAINSFIEKLDIEEDEEDLGLAGIIETGEDPRHEFKETFLWDVYREEPNKELKEEAAKEICAFANSEGGILIIGVEDDTREVKGIDRDLKLMKNGKQSFEEQLNQVIRDKIGDKFGSIYTKMNFEQINEETVCVVSVDPSSDPVYFGEDEKFYVRQGSSSIPLNIGEATDYIQEHWN